MLIRKALLTELYKELNSQTRKFDGMFLTL